MTPTWSRGKVAFLVLAPLAWAALLLFHPLGSGEVYDLLRDQVTRWQVVHVGTLLFIGLMGLAVFTLVRDLPGRAARVARFAAGTFVVFYGAWEAVAGLAAGALAQHTNSLPAAERAGGADAIQALYESPIVGDFGLLSSVGSLGWVTAVLAAAVALRNGRRLAACRGAARRVRAGGSASAPRGPDRARLLCRGGAADPPRYEGARLTLGCAACLGPRCPRPSQRSPPTSQASRARSPWSSAVHEPPRHTGPTATGISASTTAPLSDRSIPTTSVGCATAVTSPSSANGVRSSTAAPG